MTVQGMKIELVGTLGLTTHMTYLSLVREHFSIRTSRERDLDIETSLSWWRGAVAS
jgi:hypothetical protein